VSPEQREGLKVRATAVLVENGEILLVEQRVTGSRSWSLPGGTLELGETLGACLAREVEEETGLVVGIERLLYVCDRMEAGRQVLHITFSVVHLGGNLRIGEEPESAAEPIRSVKRVPISALGEYGFDSRFRDLALAGFPGSGSYQGAIGNIGL
jgi:ADP-ribose pyrophosphatase YjhB (NUDIX family)